MVAAVSDTSGRFESPYWFVFDVKGVVGFKDARPEGIEVEDVAVEVEAGVAPNADVRA